MAASPPVLPSGKGTGIEGEMGQLQRDTGDTACETREELNEDKDTGI